MRSVLALLVLAAAWLVPPGTALGETASGWHKNVVTLEAPVAIPVGHPLSDRFGLGAMPSLSAAVPLGQWTLLGLRLRGGFLSNGPPPKNPALKDPGTGGLAMLSVTARLRPLASRYPDSRAQGPFIEIGGGPGLTGSLARAMAEAAVGWNFRLSWATLGPSVRYLRVFQPSNNVDPSDAQIVLAGLEFTLHDAHDPGPSAAALAELAKAKTSDRDGDGIPDDLDKCPDEPEDIDGFEDDDGCPDPDNDQDGIPDTADACPNEPETFNGFEDEDGCPDEAPIAVKKDRIVLTELVLFDSGQSRVRPEGRPALTAVFSLWKQHPEWNYLVVDGHADRHGPADFNIELSRARAESVIKMLIGMGFPAEKLRIRAFGQRRPRVAGDSDEADRENRRVEFVIVKKRAAPAPATVPASAQSLEPAPLQPDEPAPGPAPAPEPEPTPAQEDASAPLDAQPSEAAP